MNKPTQSLLPFPLIALSTAGILGASFLGAEPAVTAPVNTNTPSKAADQKPSNPAPNMEADGAHRLNGSNPAERAVALVRYAASLKPKDELYPKVAASAYAARLILNVDTSYALAKLDAAVSSRIAMAKKKLVANPLNPPGLDPFDKVVLIHTYFLGKDKIPKTTALKIRDYAALYAHKVWKGYGAMNYRLMMDGGGYLAAQE